MLFFILKGSIGKLINGYQKAMTPGYLCACVHPHVCGFPYGYDLLMTLPLHGCVHGCACERGSAQWYWPQDLQFQRTASSPRGESRSCLSGVQLLPQISWNRVQWGKQNWQVHPTLLLAPNHMCSFGNVASISADEENIAPLKESILLCIEKRIYAQL